MPETEPLTSEAPSSPADRAVNGEVRGLYEGMFVFDSADFATEGDGFVERVTELLEKNDANIDAHRMWQDGRLAYPIRNKRKGAHYIFLFSLPPANVKALDRQCKLEDKILRHMFIRPPEEIYHATVDVVNPSEEADEDGEGEVAIPE